MISERHALSVISMVLLAGTLSVATAQYTVDTRPPRGFMPAADQISSPIDSIDPVNGKLHLQIPLGSLPQGRAGSGFDVDLAYDSHLYDVSPHTVPAIPPNMDPVWVNELYPAGSSGGWQYNFTNFRLDGEQRSDINPVCPTSGPLRVFRYRVGLPDGSQHILHLRGYSEELPNEQYQGDGFFGIAANGLPPTDQNGNPLGCWTSSGWGPVVGRLTYFTTDGSYLKLEINANGSYWWNNDWYLYFPDGRRAVGRGSQIQALYDANGNKIVFENGCNDEACNQPYTAIYHEPDQPDTENQTRWVRVDYNTTNANLNDPNVTQKTDTVKAPGPNGPVIWTVNWKRVIVGIATRHPGHILRGCARGQRSE